MSEVLSFIMLAGLLVASFILLYKVWISYTRITFTRDKYVSLYELFKLNKDMKKREGIGFEDLDVLEKKLFPGDKKKGNELEQIDLFYDGKQKKEK